METSVLEEHGYNAALYGLSLSFKDRAIPVREWWTTERKAKMAKTAAALAHRDGGHNKFLESMVVYLDIEAPRFWWSEFDTYRVGVTKQSESTMHTLKKRDLTPADFEAKWIGSDVCGWINTNRDSVSLVELKAMLPESYLQRRVVVLNYKVLRTMILQRKDHKLPHWKLFLSSVLSQLEHPELLPGLD